MLAALVISPVVLMSVAFTGMLACAGIAAWLWLRHRRAVRASLEPSVEWVSTTAAPGPRSSPRHDPGSAPPLELGRSETAPDDSFDEDEVPTDATEFIPSPLALAKAQGLAEAGDGDDPTCFVAPCFSDE